VLALSACAELGLDPTDPPAAADEPGELARSGPTVDADGALPPPLPGPAAAGAAATSDGTGDETGREGSNEVAAAPDGLAPEDPAAVADAPHVYMELQPDGGGATSVVFAIDASRDGTPADEPAIRITPEAVEAGSGRCNPQQLRYFRFSPESAGRPIYGPDDASRGVGARDLPEFMATAVSAEMIARGIAGDLEATRPQNVCTRKLFERTIIAASTGQG
jgi:hypothetical protein